MLLLHVIHAPKNADGEYDVFAWIQGGTPDHKKGGYLGGTTKVTWSSIKKYVWQHCPQRHQKWAIIDGTFSINGVNHTGNPKDHIMSDDR